jgi:hypothetical protein
MRHSIDTGILLGKILVDDDFHDSSTKFFSDFRYGELELDHQVLVDLMSLVHSEANYIMLKLLKMCPVRKLAAADSFAAKEMIRVSMGKIKREGRMKHSGIKDEVKEVLYRAVDENRIVEAVKGLHLNLPKHLHTLISGCLGEEALANMKGEANSESEVETKKAIELQLALHKGLFGDRDDHDRRILAGLIIECHKNVPMRFYTYDRAFFDGYKKLHSCGLAAPLEQARFLSFVYLNPHNANERHEFSPSVVAGQ